MNKLGLTLSALVLCASIALAQVAQYFSAALSAPGTTTPVIVGANNHTLQVTVTGGTTCAVQLEGSLDGVNYQNLSGSQSCVGSTMFHVNTKPVTWVRAILTAFNGTTAVISYRGGN